MLYYHIAIIALYFAVYQFAYTRGLTHHIRQKKKERKRIEATLPKAKIAKLILVLLLPVYLNAQSGLLVGMGASYSKGLTGDLVVGYKTGRISTYYNQIAYLSADKPAYFGLSAGYDLLHKENIRISFAAGYYFRKQSSDVKGKEGGNYWLQGYTTNFNYKQYSLIVRYIDKDIHVGIMISGSLSKRI